MFAVDVHELQFKVRNLLLICQAWKGVVSSVVWRFEHVRVSSRSYTRSFARARRHAPGDSNMNVTVSPASSAFIVIASSLPAHFNIFACEEFKIKPAKLVSQLHRTRPPRARAHHRARPRRSTQTIFFHRSTSTHPPRDVTRRHTRAASRAPTANRERPDRAWNRLAPRACAPRRPFDDADRRTIFARFIPIVNARSHR